VLYRIANRITSHMDPYLQWFLVDDNIGIRKIVETCCDFYKTNWMLYILWVALDGTSVTIRYMDFLMNYNSYIKRR
jgi:hypothetical protein